MLPACGTPLHAQNPQKFVPAKDLFDQLPFDEWVKQGPKQQVRWQTQVGYLGLSGYQRQLVGIEAYVDLPDLLQRPRDRQLILLVQLTDSAGRRYRSARTLELSSLKAVPNGGRHELQRFDWKAFALPGDYQVVMALYHADTGEHNLAQKRLRVPAIHNDPLANAWRGLPGVEFWAPISVEDIDFFYRPEFEDTLDLPLETHRPVHMEIMVDLAASDLFHGSDVLYSRYLSAVLPTMKIFSQIQVKNGTTDVSVLDLSRREVRFRQENARQLDWEGMKHALTKNGAAVVSVDALSPKHKGPALIKEELTRRLTAEGESGEREAEPLRVFVLISSPLGLYSFAGLKSSLMPANCSCVVYYLEYDSSRRPGMYGAIGNVKKMLRPLPVHAFEAHSADAVRKALAVILRDVREAADR